MKLCYTHDIKFCYYKGLVNIYHDFSSELKLKTGLEVDISNCINNVDRIRNLYTAD